MTENILQLKKKNLNRILLRKTLQKTFPKS